LVAIWTFSHLGDSPDKLFSLNVLNELNQQELPLREAIGDNFVFCQAVREAYGVRIAHDGGVKHQDATLAQSKGACLKKSLGVTCYVT
jgi:hypothetical protein